MSTRILHVSDLHFGAEDDRVGEPALAALVARVQPALIVASGDLTHRGVAGQHEAAARFLRSLGAPVLAVPGNHDIPHTFPARFTRPWALFEQVWQTTEPVFESETLCVTGVNSARPWRHQSGGVDDAQLAQAAERLQGAPGGALRVVVLHHQLVGAPWRTRKRPVAHRAHVLEQLVLGGVDLILGGHIHQGTVCERHEFDVSAEGARTVVISVAPGLGRPRPARRGESRGVVVYTAGESTLLVETFSWRGDDWTPTAARTFPRGSGRLGS